VQQYRLPPQLLPSLHLPLLQLLVLLSPHLQPLQPSQLVLLLLGRLHQQGLPLVLLDQQQQVAPLLLLLLLLVVKLVRR